MANLNTPYSTVLWRWIETHTWRAQSLLVITEISSSGDIFRFRSGFGDYFEVEATYVKAFNALTSVHLKLLVPGKATATTLVEAECYPISTEEGEALTFNLGNDYVKGSVSFQYGGDQNIYVKYDTSLPFAENVRQDVNIAPIDVKSAFEEPQLEGIAIYPDSSLEKIEERARSGKLVVRVPDTPLLDQQNLLVKFLQDFVVGGDKIIVETYSSSTEINSRQWEGFISFLGVLELSGSIDPTTFTISALLNSRVPSLGEVYLAGVQGSLKTGVTVALDDPGAHGTATLTVDKNSDGRHVLYIDASIYIRLYDQITTDGKIPLHTLRF